MTDATCELIWIRLLGELRVKLTHCMRLNCNNQAVIHITVNPVFHDRTEHMLIIILFDIMLWIRRQLRPDM